MAMLGHVSAAMSLRYARLFDATVRADYERALAQAKTILAVPSPAGRGRCWSPPRLLATPTGSPAANSTRCAFKTTQA